MGIILILYIYKDESGADHYLSGMQAWVLWETALQKP